MRQLLLPLLLLTFAARADVPIVIDGNSNTVIVLPKDPTPAQQRGARELQSHIHDMSGGNVPIVAGVSPLPEKCIVIGATDFPDAVNLGDDGFILRTQGQRIYIFATGRRGAMYGCTALLQKMGVRWFSSDVTRIPQARSITIPDLDEVQIPAFEYREPFFTEAFDKDWAARNRCNGHSMHLDESTGGRIVYHPFVHSFDELVPRKLFAEHPEYFPLIDGKRTDGYVQRCLSSPDVLEIAIRHVRRWIKDAPDAKIISVSQNDSYKFCTCDQCNAIVQKFGGEQSGLYLWFVNQVAEAIEKDHPDKLIDTLAYQFTEAAPTGIKPRANVRIRLCPIANCVSHPFEQCSAEPNVKFIQRLRAWSKLTDTLYIWHYNTNFANYLMPFPNFAEFPAEARLYKSCGVKGVFFQGDYAPGGGGAEAELRSWVMAKLLWDPSLDANALVEEWMDGVYGPAAKPMRKWFDLLHEKVRDPQAHLFIYHGANAPQLADDVLTQGDKLFDEAQELAKGNPQSAKYVAKERLCLRYAKLLKHPTTGPELDEFLKDVRAAGITQLNEGRSVDDWEKAYRKAHP